MQKEKEEEEGRKVGNVKREGQEEEGKETGKEIKRMEERGKRGRGDREGSERGRVEEKKEEEFDTVVVDAPRGDNRVLQIFVKTDAPKAVVMEVSPEDKVHSVVEKILNTVNGSDCDMYVTCEGKLLKGNEEPKSCGVRDGSTVQVVRRLRGGGKHKDKKSQKERKQAAGQKKQEQKCAGETKNDKGPAIRECDNPDD